MLGRYDWTAMLRDGSTITRWNADGTENEPDPWYTTQFHLAGSGEPPVSLYVPRGAEFKYARRHRVGPEGVSNTTIYVMGWQWPDDPNYGCFIYCLPDGRIELSNSFHHQPRMVSLIGA